MQIQIEFISAQALGEQETKKKVDFLLNSIKEDKILVLEEPLTPEEEKALIQATMKKVSPDFPGIEISTMGTNGQDWRNSIIRLLGGKVKGLTVVGPSKIVKQIKRDPNSISLLAGDGRRR